MAIQYVTRERVSIRDISQVIGHAGTTELEELKEPLDHYGIAFSLLSSYDGVVEAVTGRSHIVICPVRMSEFSYGSDRDGSSTVSSLHYGKYRTYEGGHFLVVKGFTADGKWAIIYDPLVFGGSGDARYWYSTGEPKGKERYYSTTELRSAMSGWHALEITVLADPGATGPTLRIDGSIASQRRQLEAFSFVGAGFTPGAIIVQHVQHPDGSVEQYSAVATPSGTLSWSYTPPCTASVGTYTVWVDDARKGPSNRVSETVTANDSCVPDLPSTATLLVMDVSGSMGERWKGGVKIDSAKEAALQFIEQVTNESRTRGGRHTIGVVAFSGQAQLLLPLTSDYQRARQVIISLSATNSTNVGAGLTTALTEFGGTRGETERLVILLSDGNSNTGLSKDQVLSGPVVEALRKHVCVHTVAFGDPDDVDDAFLRGIAGGSGCGSFNLAQTGFQLFSTFLKLRDASLGQIAGEYSSAGRQVTFVAGSPVVLGTIIVGSGKDELHLTLAWSAEGTLQARLKDPSGRLVTSAYAGAEVYSSRRFAHITVYTPSGGAWTIEAAPTTQMPSGTEYYAVLSTRPGGIALPLPLPVFTIGGQTFGLPAGLPTWLLVAAGVALLALAIYAQFSKL